VIYVLVCLSVTHDASLLIFDTIEKTLMTGIFMANGKKQNIALFDFDGTITERELFSIFLKYSASRMRKTIGNLIILPFYILYKRGLLSPIALRKMSAFLALFGRKFKSLNQQGKQFSTEIIPQYLRKNALERILYHKLQGDTVVVVSASLNLYLTHWCQEQGLALICNEVALKNGYATGKFVADDCSNEMKVKRVLSQFDLSNFDQVFAYGDTEEDLAMLKLADVKYMGWQIYG